MGAYVRNNNGNITLTGLAALQVALQPAIEDMNEHLFGLLKNLKDITNDPNGERRDDLLTEILNFIMAHEQNIDPFYVDYSYENQFGTNKANFFAIIKEMQNINDNSKRELIIPLMNILLLDTRTFIDTGELEGDREFDANFVVDKVLSYFADNQLSNNLIRALSSNAYTFAQLQHVWSTYPSALETLFLPEVMNAHKLGIDIGTIMTLRNKNTHQGDVTHANTRLERFFGADRLSYLQSQNTVQLFKDIINAQWPTVATEFYKLCNNLINKEYFEMITSAKVKTFIDSGLYSLQDFLSMPKENLSSFLANNTTLPTLQNNVGISDVTVLLASTVNSNGTVSPATVVTIPASLVNQILSAIAELNIQSLTPERN